MTNIVSCIAIFFLTISFVGAQEEFASLVKAKYKKGNLSLTFSNTSTDIRRAPDISLRTDTLGMFLYHKYFFFTGDTLILKLSSEVSEDLYTLINREGGVSTGRLFYNDPPLKSGQRRRFKVRIVSIPENIRVIKLGDNFARLRR